MHVVSKVVRNASLTGGASAKTPARLRAGACPVGLATPLARQRGGTFLGVLLGIVLGLGMAAVTAYVIYQAPLPFIAGQPPANPQARPEVQLVPEAPVPAEPVESNAGLPDPNQNSSRERVMPQVDQGAGVRGSDVSTVDLTAEQGGAVERQGAATGRFLLQAGAFRHPTDAETLKLRLALNGLEAHVATANVNGQTLYRVRLGPYESLEAANVVRRQLADERIEAAVVRLRGQ
ncbi:MAG: SPOR domain-containing protein [Lautropia sp.]|nr:SPOR domain-containing protein [Lautropia sp.]